MSEGTAPGIVKIAVLAIGGQGGGVVSDWLVALAERNGWDAQSTSVPGVAQRTGATLYYIEMLPASDRTPVLALMPSPGDVDLVLAAEWTEAGRAIQRGLVTPDRTTLIASTHRAYAVTEKSAPGDGRADPEVIAAAAQSASRRLIALDLQALAEQSGSVISASLFGALAGSGVLPFPHETYEETIREGGRGIEASLRAFRAGLEAAASGLPPAPPPAPVAAPSEIRGPSEERSRFEGCLTRLRGLPEEVRDLAEAGLRKVVDFQDAAYGAEYLDRLDTVLDLDRSVGGNERDFALTRECAKYIANAMAYDDVIRVADLKTRASRFRRVRREVGVNDDQVLAVTEFMHPRVQEICATLPRRLALAIEGRPGVMRLMARLFERGRRVRTDTLFWFLGLYAVGGLQRYRRGLLRHSVETAHLDEWLSLVRRTAPRDYRLAVEIVRCRRLIKGYSDTHRRGIGKYDKVLSALPILEGRPDAADWIRRLRDAALKDEEGSMLDGALMTIRTL